MTETDPTCIDWAARQAAAAIPFQVVEGRPVNPYAPTGVRHGRGELEHWGEALAADALVSATDLAGRRWILMVQRSDGHGWAIPGGHVDPGETPAQAAFRELAEETGLVLPNGAGGGWQAGKPRYVPDPRASDEAWMVTVLCTAHLGTVDRFPHVAGADDAARAEWVRADTYDTLTAHLASAYDGQVFAAHVAMLQDTLRPNLTITTFGYLHGAPPAAHLTIDLRTHFRDPHVDPALRYMTAHDRPVREAVMATPGIHALVDATAAAVAAYLSGPSAGPVTVAIGCAGGRHRAATVGIELADELAVMRDVPARVVHRDLNKPVIDRPTQAA